MADTSTARVRELVACVRDVAGRIPEALAAGMPWVAMSPDMSVHQRLVEAADALSRLVEERDRLAREIVDRADTEQSMAQAMAEDGEEIARLRAPITAEMVRPLLCSIVSCEQHTAQAERIAADVNRARGLAPQE